ncbi:hypothetical protein [Cupriavidus necator]|uniref:hypothetical protein n=1 Tax=Cupriavidus necator TaxID=106590 RepID=UPI0005B455CB|nr:hypothetical protein [Cupriavidus necator]
MRELPILFSGAMVRAILDGRKTQTRRVVKPKRGWPIDFVGGGPVGGPDWNDPACWGFEDLNTAIWWLLKSDGDGSEQIPCPHGQPGDRLWVRETFFAFGRWETRFSEKKGRDEWHFVDMTLNMDRIYQYADPTPDNARHRSSVTPAWWKRPAIHMPRAASRILLDVGGVRGERLNDCSDADAIAEGCAGGHGSIPAYPYSATPHEHYRWLWDSINGAGAWDANPWVWVVEFKRVEA